MKRFKNFLNLAMPYDLYERHTVVGQLLQKQIPSDANTLVLDVGGRRELLDRFLPHQTISINPDGTGLLCGDGLKLPFAANSFAAVVNIDTLEHLPAEIRLPFIEECLRVSQKLVIIAAPYGSEGHIQLEKELSDHHQNILKRPHPYLSEHVEYILPSPEQLADFAQKLHPATSQFYYAGDFTWQGRNFARALQAHQQPRWLARLTNVYNRISGMALFHPITLSHTPKPSSNRFYLSITKSK
ncbi:MAG: class I SAM-dependent methyltransferase [Chloroflexi bacterium]|nr:class I SAM-dependent methyltransferase [Chloroflexota bacterium]